MTGDWDRQTRIDAGREQGEPTPLQITNWDELPDKECTKCGATFAWAPTDYCSDCMWEQSVKQGGGDDEPVR